MHFLIDNQLKLIFGFSAKCGCSNVRRLFLSITKEESILNLYNLKGHVYVGHSGLPKDISSFRIYIFIRNPYERICSGFFNKYNEKHYIRKFWKNEKELTFKNFVNTITVEGIGKQIETHHFTPQTTVCWEDRLLESQNVKFIDIKDIIKVKEDIYNELNKTIVSNKMNKKSKNYIANAYNIQIDELIKMSPDYKCLYNHELKEKVYNFYKKDFEIFKKFGFDYDI
tara:strand:+ start:180 stop:857 length:678 start_codon:yes stop_codon:yes gene_type:complete